jgi:hypothetical protein
LICLALGGALLVVTRQIHDFLAVSAPVRGGALVVEGWLPDHALQEVVAEAGRNAYTAVYVIGGPIERGAPMSEYGNYAQLGAVTLTRLGLPTNTLHAAPAPFVRADRTYAAAMALRRWFEEHGGAPAKMNVISIGPHARRSRLLFTYAFGRQTQVGIISLPNPEYDPRRWWTYSTGFRNVVLETVGYLYVKLVFRRSEGAEAVARGGT